MGIFKDRAVLATSISKIMEGRVKISNDELMTKYPDGVTILGFDWMKGDDGKFPVCIFEENGNECFFGGTVLTSICEAWMEGFETTEDCSMALASEGGVKIKFSKCKTKQNRTLTKCEVVE